MHYSVVIMFDRTSRRGITMLPRYNKTIVASCDWGPWVLYTLGGKWHPRLCPLGCTKRHGSRHSVQQLYTGAWAWAWTNLDEKFYLVSVHKVNPFTLEKKRNNLLQKHAVWLILINWKQMCTLQQIQDCIELLSSMNPSEAMECARRIVTWSEVLLNEPTQNILDQEVNRVKQMLFNSSKCKGTALRA